MANDPKNAGGKNYGEMRRPKKDEGSSGYHVGNTDPKKRGLGNSDGHGSNRSERD